VLPAIKAMQLEDLLGIEKAPGKEITVAVDDKPVQQRNPAYAA
jgi:hypothetical protein